MNENIDLTKILEGCPKGTEFYSTVFGKVYFNGFINYGAYPIQFIRNGFEECVFAKDGKEYTDYDGECVIFPSRDQRDWSKFERFWDKPKVQRFDVNTLQPFDKVLSRYGTESIWMCTFFSHIIDKVNPRVDCNGITVNVCIPYNDDTKHLVGTNKDCPEYYKWWKK